METENERMRLRGQRVVCTTMRPGSSQSFHRATSLSSDKFHYSSSAAAAAAAWLGALLVAAASLDLTRANLPPAGSPASSPLEAFQQYLNQLRDQDQCGAIFTGKSHGYDVKDYLVRTNDKYELHIHRLVHPEDFLTRASDGPRPKKKPYLLVHGLIGTSASFLTNIEPNYRPPPVSYDVGDELHSILQARSQDYQYEWQSTAEYLKRNSMYEQPEKFANKQRQFAESLELQFDGEHMRFGREFRQAYKKFRLPKASIGYATNSLAMTLVNFGYDVWLINLRGNQYSRRYNGPMAASRAEYWDFNIQTIIKEDLAATIRFIERETALREGEHLGVVTYSYSSIHLMGLLTKFPKYQKQLRPIIMLAPTLLTGTQERGKFNYFMKLANQLISRNGPFPGRDLQSSSSTKSHLLSFHNLDHKLKKLACQLPVASKLCRLLEMVILGKPKQVSSVRGLLTSDKKTSLLQRDIDCGSTSKQILHQVIENLSEESIDPAYKPFAPAKQSSMLVMGRQEPARPSLMIMHSDSDSISTPAEVRKIRDSALKTLTLADYLIREPNFEHTDFLFSSRNQYLVNAELVRMALVHDHLSYLFDAPPTRMSPAPYDARRQQAPAPYRGSSASSAAASSGAGSASAASAAGPRSAAAAAAAAASGRSGYH